MTGCCCTRGRTDPLVEEDPGEATGVATSDPVVADVARGSTAAPSVAADDPVPVAPGGPVGCMHPPRLAMIGCMRGPLEGDPPRYDVAAAWRLAQLQDELQRCFPDMAAR